MARSEGMAQNGGMARNRGMVDWLYEAGALHLPAAALRVLSQRVAAGGGRACVMRGPRSSGVAGTVQPSSTSTHMSHRTARTSECAMQAQQGKGGGYCAALAAAIGLLMR
eukprot:CAMPEP_0184379204 /NCGR_PEP_ID=MMETSP0007-20130409/3647_1 /TAXON_ID=97485 /ORGANISM="Prymnesium parvum, Strain Texoma1" /LENGTH=109 /DNA_ID=CAMNT_0026723771 /DNA_START=329 /DNA_END=657 /DNA_ORIENTATION=-